jgi:hypothetical protein
MLPEYKWLSLLDCLLDDMKNADAAHVDLVRLLWAELWKTDVVRWLTIVDALIERSASRGSPQKISTLLLQTKAFIWAGEACTVDYDRYQVTRALWDFVHVSSPQRWRKDLCALRDSTLYMPRVNTIVLDICRQLEQQGFVLGDMPSSK